MDGDEQHATPAEPVALPDMSAANKTTLRAILICGLLVAVAGIWVGPRPTGPVAKKSSTAVAAKQSPRASAVIPNESVSESVTIDSTAPNGARLSVPATVSVEVPVSWRTQIAGDLNDSATDCSASLGSEDCLSFRFANALGSPTSLISADSMTLYNLDGWLATNGSDNSFGTETALVKKKALVSAVVALAPSAKLTPSSIANFFNPFGVSTGFAGVSDVQYIQSEDGALKGYSFIASLGPQVDYRPQTFAVMIGQEHGVTVAVGGAFEINDAERRVNPQSNEFIQSYTAGYHYAVDTLIQNDQALSVMESVKLAF
jgi:hypothetical protein